jgi:hypothetical protein
MTQNYIHSQVNYFFPKKTLPQLRAMAKSEGFTDVREYLDWAILNPDMAQFADLSNWSELDTDADNYFRVSGEYILFDEAQQ